MNARDKKTKVLVVDGDVCEGTNLRLFFWFRGIEARQARNGEEAMRELAKDRFDLVLSRVQLRGMGGMELLRNVHERQPDTAVILMTAAINSQREEQALASGAVAVLHRPLHCDELNRAYQVALRSNSDHMSVLAPADAENALAV